MGLVVAFAAEVGAAALLAPCSAELGLMAAGIVVPIGFGSYPALQKHWQLGAERLVRTAAAAAY